MRKNVFFFLMAGILLMITGCSKEDTEPEVKLPSVAKDSVLVNVPTGLKHSSDPFAQWVVSFFDGLNGIARYSNDLRPPQGAASFHADVAGAVAYTWTDGSVTYWLVYHEENGKCIWRVDADFGEGKQQYIYGEQSCDGKNGKLDVQLPGEGDYHASWQYDDKNVFSFTIESTYNNMSLTLEGEINPDGSGHASVKNNGMVLLTVTWNADGSGSYKLYTSNPPYEGSWSND